MIDLTFVLSFDEDGRFVLSSDSLCDSSSYATSPSNRGISKSSLGPMAGRTSAIRTVHWAEREKFEFKGN